MVKFSENIKPMIRRAKIWGTEYTLDEVIFTW